MALLGATLCMGSMLAFMLLPLIINILIGYWMYKDATKRGKSGGLWFVIGFFLSLLGLIIWLVVRPKDMPQQPQTQPPAPPQQ